MDEHGKKKARIEEAEDRPSSFRQPRPPWHLFDGTDGVTDGGIQDSGARAWKKGGGEEEELDPLEVFGSGIMMLIVRQLDARSVALSRLVCRAWHSLASSDRIWGPKVPFFVPFALHSDFLLFASS
ncbi:F-box family protein [Dorcoceras hygrometricum]|uniref:F-box family protein n=1 Tax=Dorcoceras hygrometricum TaxID=472368 RepID=A0A2Z7DIR9_9LAMI|nr:F-box family protein [Dorcoceras hygrometricum]